MASLLLEKVWKANPNWYDYWNEINLQKCELETGGGQTTNMECKISVGITLDLTSSLSEDVVEEGEIRFKYLEKKSPYWNACPKFGENAMYTSKYKVCKGPFTLQNRWDDEVWRYKLVLESCPMPSPQLIHGYMFGKGDGMTYWNCTEYYGNRLGYIPERILFKCPSDVESDYD
jgi:hypothetical protein